MARYSGGIDSTEVGVAAGAGAVRVTGFSAFRKSISYQYNPRLMHGGAHDRD
jgi:hypothetical protein